MNKKNQYGFIHKEIEADEYVLGGRQLPRPVLQPTGQWHEYLPDYERQFTDLYDTYGCTVYGTLNALEMLDRRLKNRKSDYSERFTYNLVPVRPPGSDPHLVAETVRKFGLIDQALLPMTTTFEEFTATVKPDALRLGLGWLKTNDMGHEWLWKGNIAPEAKDELLRDALRYSPIGVSVSAWTLVDGVYIDNDQPNNHWCVLIGFYDITGKIYKKVFDSYDQTIKILHPEHKIQFAKRYTLTEKVEKSPPWWKVFINKIFKRNI